MCTALWLEGRSTVQRALLAGSGLGRPGGRPTGQLLIAVDWAVDRQVNCWPGRPAVPESGYISVGRPRGRPAYLAGPCARFVHIGRPIRSTNPALVDRPIDRQWDLADISEL